VASHRDLIVDQFTRQAVPFSTAPGILDEDALRLLVEAAGAGPDDTVLDVACGPGLVVAAFARVVRHATGIDLTPAMITRAETVARERGLTNVSWRVGDVQSLPFADASFSIVGSRFAFHHLRGPGAVLAEMRRVCAPGGRVVLADVVAPDDPQKAAAFDRMELLRDPSHVRALRLAEMRDLFTANGLPAPVLTQYKLKSELEGLLSRSFPNPGDAERIRQMVVDSLANDGLGMGTHRRGDEIRLAYPVAVLVAAA
jgi:ubiquinone/menaquinone biosynthesis C-methylase UbiE